MNQSVIEQPANTNLVTVIYVLYLLALVSGVTAVIGVVMAYIYRDQGPEWLRTHYDWLIRTFWIGLLYTVIAGILCTILIGFVLLFAVAIWWIIRCVKGLKYLDQRTAYPNYIGWGF